MSAELDTVKKHLGAFITFVMRRVDYFALYPCTVSAQNTDGTLELVPDSSKLPAKSKVPIRHGLPGVAVKVEAGARVLVGFEGGRPTHPYAALWDISTAIEITINGGNKNVAHVGSSVTGRAGPWDFVPSSQVSSGTPVLKVP